MNNFRKEIFRQNVIIDLFEDELDFQEDFDEASELYVFYEDEDMVNEFIY